MKNPPISIRERVTRTVEKWFILEPLCFLVWTTHELVANPRLRTVRTGNGRIEYNPAFFDTMPDAELEAVLKAEVIRILLKHPYSRRKENAQAAYLASNITLKEHSGTPLPFPTAQETFGKKDFDKRHFEFYYDRLLEPNSLAGQGPATDKAAPGSLSKIGGQSQAPAPPAPNEMENEAPEENQAPPDIPEYADAGRSANENTEYWSENEWLAQLINDKIETVRQSQSWGTIPGKLQELIIAAMRPRLDYRRILGAFRQSVLSTNRTLTRMKPSRRYGFEYMGSRRDFCTKLLFALDVSGSVPSQDLRRALATLNQFFRYGIEAVDVVQFDSSLKGQPMTVKKARRHLDITGRGGTNFDPVFQLLNENRGYDGAVIFTDGYAPPPKALKHGRTKILWLFNTEASYEACYPSLKASGKGAFLK